MALSVRVCGGMSDLSRAQNERLRRAMAAVLRDEFGGNVSKLARALERSQPAVRSILAAEGGAAFATAQRFAEFRRQEVLEVIGPVDVQPGEDLSFDRTAQPASTTPTVPETEVSLRGLLDWYYATPGIKRCVDEHADVTVGDLLRYRAEPARHGEADADEVYRHIQQLRRGPIATTVPSFAVPTAELEANIVSVFDDALRTRPPPPRHSSRPPENSSRPPRRDVPIPRQSSKSPIARQKPR
jgi:hypothetical protein